MYKTNILFFFYAFTFLQRKINIHIVYSLRFPFINIINTGTDENVFEILNKTMCRFMSHIHGHMYISH